MGRLTAASIGLQAEFSSETEYSLTYTTDQFYGVENSIPLGDFTIYAEPDLIFPYEFYFEVPGPVDSDVAYCGSFRGETYTDCQGTVSARIEIDELFEITDRLALDELVAGSPFLFFQGAAYHDFGQQPGGVGSFDPFGTTSTSSQASLRFSVSYTYVPTVPLPASALLLGAGVIGLGRLGRRRAGSRRA